MNDRQVEVLADRLRDIKTLSALQGGVYPVYLRPDEMDLAEKTLRSRTPSAPDVAMKEALADSGWHVTNWDRARNSGRILLVWREFSGVREHVELGWYSDSKSSWVNTYGKPFAYDPDGWAPLIPFKIALSASEAKAGEPDELVPIYCKPWRTIVFVKAKHKSDFLAKNGAPTPPQVDREAVARLARLRFFRDLVEADRIKFYKAFDVLPQDYEERLTLSIEGKLFDAILSLLAPTAPAQEGE